MEYNKWQEEISDGKKEDEVIKKLSRYRNIRNQYRNLVKKNKQLMNFYDACIKLTYLIIEVF